MALQGLTSELKLKEGMSSYLKSLSLIELKHMEELQENSLTNADKLEKKFRDYVTKNGVISKDDFIGKLINGDLGGDSANGNFS